MTSIEWTDETWNPFRGCTKISPGCKNCYAKTFAERFRGVPGHPFEQGFDPRFVPERLDVPLRWKKPRRVFVNSMSDLFHESFSNAQIAAVFGVMAAASQHTFQVLTKRPERMRDWFNWIREQAEELQGAVGERPPSGHAEPSACVMLAIRFGTGEHELLRSVAKARWPLPNVWLGVSAEDQATADKRIPLLLGTPAAIRFVSAEPLLGPVDFTRIDFPGLNMPPTFRFDALAGGGGKTSTPWKIDWVVTGGESGPGARPCEVEWIRSIVRQCREAHVPVFVKQLGAKPALEIEPTGNFRTHNGQRQFEMNVTLLPIRDRKGADPSEWPADIRVREMPEVRP